MNFKCVGSDNFLKCEEYLINKGFEWEPMEIFDLDQNSEDNNIRFIITLNKVMTYTYYKQKDYILFNNYIRNKKLNRIL